MSELINRVYDDVTASITAGDPIFPVKTMSKGVGYIRVALRPTVEGVYSLKTERPENAAVSTLINSGTAIAAGAGFTFEQPMTSGETYTITSSTTGTHKAQVEEVYKD